MYNYSIIIPHYDIPELLVRCLRSIPVRPDVQVIVVDDCSPDADQYMSRYPELSRPHLEYYSTSQPGSAGRARNVGLEHAQGRWVLFADADDFFASDLAMLLDRYRDREEELIYFRIRCVQSDDISQPAQRSEWLDVMWSDYEQNHDLASLCGRSPNVWGKLIKRELVEQHHIRFEETRYSNDFWFAACVASRATRVSVERETLYIITVRSHSLAYQMNQKEGELEERAAVCFRVEQMLLKQGIHTLPFEPFTLYLRLLFDSPHRRLYHSYFRCLPQIGFSRRLALSQMCERAGLRRRIKVWLISYLHLFLS